jgi:ParB family chromosome partitioning protein
MQRKGANVSLKSVDDLFSTQEERDTTEHVQEIPLSEPHPFKDHPFKVLDDEAMQKTVESIREYGVLTPAIARPRPEGGYELISGHRRHHASELAGKETMPVIVRDMDDDAATILMVDSNLQREEILPSERAKAYKMKLEAIKHQGERSDLTSVQVGPKLDAASRIAADADESRSQVKRYIRLTNLIPELQDMVDEKKISFNPAVELSYLTPEEQKMFAEALEASQIAPSLSQAQRMKKMSQQGQLTQETMEDMLSEDKKAPLDRVVFDQSQIRKYFPKSYTTKQMQEKIIQLLEQWQRKQQRDMER